MYLKHFGLDRSPFKITPDTSLFYEGGNRGAALEAVKYSILQGEGIVKVVGEVGSGKTMLCRMLEVRLPDYVEIVYLANPSLSPERILHVIAMEMKLPVEQNDDKSKVMQMLQDHLLDVHSQGRQVVVFIEEAQGMPLATLEEIRLLSNLETKQHKLLQIVLFGQPELDENLSKREIRQLKERITHHFSLDTFEKSDIQSYLNFRLRAAGYKGQDLFASNLASVISRYSKGLTRRINILADKALLCAYSENSHLISVRHIKMAARDSQYVSNGMNKPARVFAIALVISLLISTGWFLKSFDEMPIEMSKVVSQVNAASIENKSIFSGETDNHQLISDNSDLLSGRLNASKAFLMTGRDKSYSIQLIMFEGELNQSADNFLQKMQSLDVIEQVYIYPAVVNNRNVHHVVYGQFDSYSQAVLALDALPSDLKKARPFIRSISSIKSEITEKAL